MKKLYQKLTDKKCREGSLKRKMDHEMASWGIREFTVISDSEKIKIDKIQVQKYIKTSK